MKWRNRDPHLSNELSRLEGLEPHELLRVPKAASEEEIKRAYRNLVKVYHPDKSDPFMKEHNEEIVRLINKAFDFLLSQLAR